MENNQRKDHTAEKQLLEELKKNLRPEKLEEFTIELHLALNIFFEGESERTGNTVTLRIPSGQKFRITTELIS